MSKRSAPASVLDYSQNFLGGKKKKAKKETGAATTPSQRIIKTEGSAAAAASVVQYDDVEVVEASAPAISTADVATKNFDADNDDDVIMVGTINEVRLPHMRHFCVKFEFQQNPKSRFDISTKNSEYCDLCYCYVCDTPVKECKVSFGIALLGYIVQSILVEANSCPAFLLIRSGG
jgi:hypothetical protein